MTGIRELVAVFVGGGLGSAARYLVGLLVLQRAGPGFPYGTLLVNLLGCFAIGLVAGIGQTRAIALAPSIRLFLSAGVLGGFTTFSTFAYDAVTLMGEGALSLGAAYVVASAGLGIAAAFAGMFVARTLG